MALVTLLAAALPVQAQPPEWQKENPPAEPVATSPTPGQRSSATRPVSSDERVRLPLAGSDRYSTGEEGRELHLRRDGSYSLRAFSDRPDPTDPTNERGTSRGIWSVRPDEAIVLTPPDADRKRRFLTTSLTLYPKE